MRPLIVSEFVTLDGVMEAPGGEPGHPHTGWVGDYVDDDFMALKLGETLDAGCLLIGRVTYESFAGAWPDRDDPEGFAEKMNAMPKHVVSTTLRDPEWSNSTVIAGDVTAAVRALKRADGGPILVPGSRTLVHFLMAEGLVDELRLMVFPLTVGGGARVFPEDGVKTTFALVDSRVLGSGVQFQVLRPT